MNRNNEDKLHSLILDKINSQDAAIHRKLNDISAKQERIIETITQHKLETERRFAQLKIFSAGAGAAGGSVVGVLRHLAEFFKF